MTADEAILRKFLENRPTLDGRIDLTDAEYERLEEIWGAVNGESA